MKKFLILLLSCALVLAMSGCKDKEEPASVEPEVTESLEAVEETLEVAGEPEDDGVIVLTNEDNSTVTIAPDENGQLTFEVSITRLGVLTGGTGVDMDGFYVFAATAPNDGEVACQLTPDGEGGYRLEVVQSDWDLFPDGDVVEGFKIQ